MYILWLGLFPNITSSPNNEITTYEGITTTITCKAVGYPPPTIVWNRTNGTLSDRVSVSDNVSVLTGNGNLTRVSVNLTISSASREDTGEYTCFASNFFGSDNENISITVQCKLHVLCNSTICNLYLN